MIALLFLCAAAGVLAGVSAMRANYTARMQTVEIKRRMGIKSRWDDAFEIDDEEMLLDPTLELPERRSMVIIIGDIFDDSSYGQRLGAVLKAADIKFKPSESIGIVVLVGLLTYILADVAFSQGPLVSGIIGALTAIIVPWLVLRARRHRRLENFVKQLPTVAELVANSLRAGLSLQGAIDLMTREINDPAHEEFGILVREVRLGGSLEESLAKLEERMPSQDLGVMVTAMTVQRIAGGNLIKSMSELSKTLIERQRTMEEIKTMMAEAKFTAYIMPVISVLALAMLNYTIPHSLDVLFWTWPGLACLAIFVGLNVIGFMLIMRIARIKV